MRAGALAALLGTGAAGVSLAQQTGQQTSAPGEQKAQAAQKQKPASAAQKPSAASDNSFPADVSNATAKAGEANSAPPQSDAKPDAAPPSASAQPSAAADNPFPEDVSRKAAADANGAPTAPTGVSSSASRDPDIDREMDRDASRQRLPKPSKHVEPGSLSAIARAKDDARIGNYYLGAGDWKGAYGRFTEAAQLDPANVDVIFGTAEAARHLNHSAEAADNYRMYLEVAPDGSKAKAARKALDTLSAHK